jgi:hypothetical protein
MDRWDLDDWIILALVAFGWFAWGVVAWKLTG